VIETAIRAAAGRGVAAHPAQLGRLCAGFAAVAAGNPHAWSREAVSAEAIATPSPGNRMVAFPYTKLMVSNELVDQAAALLVCSAGRARALGVPADRLVYLHGAAEALAPTVTERPDLAVSPALEAARRLLTEMTGHDPAAAAHVDLYSCFPSAVQQQAAALGLGLDRPLTVTGGMRFSGGPWNSYVLHGLAALVPRLRAEPGALGLSSANGGYLSKFVVTLLGARPPARPFRQGSAAALLAGPPRLVLDPEPDGAGRVEGYSVMHGRAGPEQAFLACRTADGRRAWGVAREPGLLAALEAEEWVGRTVRLGPDGSVGV
jgi:acetyl-CoA C-acetyltransferase